ncbi:MAG: alpha-glucosidase/alpha-galactosidase [Spirochaetota bacterium]
MAPRIVFVGAGSIGFTRKLVADLMSVPELTAGTLVFMDIDEQNLSRVEQLVARDLEANGLPRSMLIATTDRREALRDADYVFSTVRIGGLEAFETDVEIPLRYGIDQCVGDTLSAGGIMYGQRNIPFILDLAADINELAAPDCLLMNYANPMAMNVWAAHHYGSARIVGLCHGVQGGHALIAQVLDIPPDELHYVCAGINHQTWFTELVYRGEDMTGRLLEAFEQSDVADQEPVRIDVLRRFGYFSTESNGHLSEYLPWYRKRPEEAARWIGTKEWINGETGGYLRVCREWRGYFDEEFPRLLEQPPLEYGAEHRSHEHGSYIVEALETGRLYRGHFNLVNDGAISNLPDEAVVEGPGLVDATGIRLLNVGALPPGPAAICSQSINVQRLSVEAAVRGDDSLLRQAMLMDPPVGAVCSPSEVWSLVDEMLVAQRKWLPQYEEAIAAAEARTAGRSSGTDRATTGAFTRAVRTPEEMATESLQHTRPDEG